MEKYRKFIKNSGEFIERSTYNELKGKYDVLFKNYNKLDEKLTDRNDKYDESMENKLYYIINIHHISEVWGSLSSLSDPRNREIGFVSSSFSCRASRACGRGEAAWAHVDRYPYRWASRARVSGCFRFPLLVILPLCASAWVLTAFLFKTRVNALCGHLVAHLLCTGAWVLTAFGTLLRARAPFVVAKKTWVLTPGRQKLQDSAWVLSCTT